jgi:hypothetical protein
MSETIQCLKCGVMVDDELAQRDYLMNIPVICDTCRRERATNSVWVQLLGESAIVGAVGVGAAVDEWPEEFE